jgi:fatty-acyl-CoA synthase
MTKLSQADIEKELIAITKQLLIESGEKHKREIKLDSSLQQHLRIDSMTRAELFQRVEAAFSVSLPDRMLAEVETLNDLAVHLYDAAPSVKKSAPHPVIITSEERAHVDVSHVKTLLDVILLYGENAPNKAHIYFQNEDGQEEIITYGQLLKYSLRLAQGLRERGLKEGETVAIMQPTNPGFFYTFFGVLLAGGVPVPIYPPFRMHMLEAYAKLEARILNNAEVRVLVTFDKAENLSRLLQTFVPSLKHVTTVDELMAPTSLEKPFHAKPESFAFIQYTSGSTSDPKGVLLTHYNLLSNIRAYGKAIDVRPDDVAVSWLPLYHDMGLIGMWLGSLYFGVPLVLLTPFSFLYHPERWLWAIHYHRGTLSGAPNFAYELCVRKTNPSLLEGLDLSSWRMAANGAEKIYPRTLEEFATKFARYGFKREALLPVYGLAESTVGLAIPPLDRGFLIDYVDRKAFEEDRRAVPIDDKSSLSFVACGVPIEGHQIRIVDEQGAPLPERHIGSLQFCGPSSMQGYYNNPQATKAVIHDGWIDSGDLAYQADGEVYITGRRKDLIIKAGRNLYPSEIEEVVGVVEGVRQGCVAAFAVSDNVRGTEQLVVVAETREKNKAAREHIMDAIKDAMSSALDIVPDQVVLVAPHTVPKTSSGKLQRAACKTLFVEGRLNKFRVPPWLQIAKLGFESLVRKSASIVSRVLKFIFTCYVVLIAGTLMIPLYFVIRFASPQTAVKASKFAAKMILTVMLCPVKTVHAAKLKQVSPVIYVSNHASYIDALVMMSVLPLGTRFVGKKELRDAPIIRTFMRKLNFLSIDRVDLSKGLEDTKHIEKALQAGDSIVIFPEGTFGYASGLRPFRLGAFKIAAESNTPICPIALQGTRTVLRECEKTMRPGRIRVTVCDPIYPKGSEWHDVTQLRDEVREEIIKYCGEPSLDFIAAQTIAARRVH